MRAIVILPGLIAVLLLANGTTASAHPLGNLTINHYAGLVVRADAVLVDYVVDYAEIPTVQLRSSVGADARQSCESLAGGLQVAVDGRSRSLAVVRQAVSFAPGQGGLDTMRLECQYGAELGPSADPHMLTFADTNYAERIGWREITARGDGAALRTELPTESISARLMSYPQDLFSSPPDVRRAEIRITPTGSGASSDAVAETNLPGIVARPTDALASLITRTDLGPLGFVLALAAATGLGALHALSPGHGKTVMAAYLVGSRGSFRQAAVLALAVAVSHTAGVVGLGLLTLAGSALLAPDRVYPYLTMLSAAIVLGLGIWLVGGRLRHRLAHAHGHTHVHDEVRGADSAPLGWRTLAALGLAGGVIPSASALLVLLGAISLHRLELGLVLIVAFGFGMAFTLVGVGMALVGASRMGERRLASNATLARLYAHVPTAAAVVVLLLGIGMTAQSALALAHM
ncbi:MAG: nickel transporter [Chloroflexota bacterium]|nr:nickel transporter [Chloroflexota bacterium]